MGMSVAWASSQSLTSLSFTYIYVGFILSTNPWSWWQQLTAGMMVWIIVCSWENSLCPPDQIESPSKSLHIFTA